MNSEFLKENQKTFEEMWQKKITQEVAWSAFFSAAIICLGQIFSMIMDQTAFAELPDILKCMNQLRFWHLIFSLIILIAVIVFMRSMTLFSSRMILILQLFIVMPMLWYFQAHYATQLEAWVLLMGFKVALFSVCAFSFGNVLINLLFMFGFAVEVVLFWIYFDLGSRNIISNAGEPWTVIFFGFLGLLILIFNHLRFEAQKKMLLMQVVSLALRQVAKTFVKVQDRASSPLQTLELGMGLMQREGVSKEILHPMQSSLEKLIDLHQNFRTFQTFVDWDEEKGD